MSLLMLAVVALFPVTLLAILLLTSGLEGRFVSSSPPKPRRARQAGNHSSASRAGRD
jgi:hypothetical protein